MAYPVQNHPQDSRVTIEEDATTVQTLNAKMGTGGGNTPLVLIDASGGIGSDASRTPASDGGMNPKRQNASERRAAETAQRVT